MQISVDLELLQPVGSSVALRGSAVDESKNLTGGLIIRTGTDPSLRRCFVKEGRKGS